MLAVADGGSCAPAATMCSSEILPTALITFALADERVLVVLVGRLVVDHNFATLRNIELPADLAGAEDRRLDGGDAALCRSVLRKLRSERGTAAA